MKRCLLYMVRIALGAAAVWTAIQGEMLMVVMAYLYMPTTVCVSIAYDEEKWTRMAVSLVPLIACVNYLIFRVAFGNELGRGSAAFAFLVGLFLYLLLYPFPVLRFFKRVLVGNVTSSKEAVTHDA